jgi:hypothetical protein
MFVMKQRKFEDERQFFNNVIQRLEKLKRHGTKREGTGRGCD